MGKSRTFERLTYMVGVAEQVDAILIPQKMKSILRWFQSLYMQGDYTSKANQPDITPVEDLYKDLYN